MIKFNGEQFKKDIYVIWKRGLLIVAFILGANVLLGKICPLRMVWGLPCPGCGITRAFLLVLQGKFYEATVMHPFWIVMVLLFLVFVWFRYFVPDEKLQNKAKGVMRVCIIIAFALCIAYYIYRMFYWFPDRAPMRYDPDNWVNIFKRIFGHCFG